MAIDWKHALALFEEVSDLAADARAQRMDRLAVEDPRLAAQVQALLDAHARSAEGELPARIEAELLAGDAIGDEHAGLHAGATIGGYRLLEPVGRGGMASVWLAEHDHAGLRRRFALKLPHIAHARPGLGERFARERDILARLRHPHIARLHDAGLDPGGQPWLALDYIEGAPITQWCDERRIGLRERLVLFGQVLDAVQFAHANLVIHRDLKPGNILVDEAGRVSLLDFGIAKLLGDTGGGIAETALTAAGGRLLTVQYASPEQIRGEALTTATDLYSLGVVLHELIIGTRPYRLAFESAAQLEQAIATAAREPLTRGATDVRAQSLGLRNARTLRRAIGGDLEAIVARAMAARPGERYASAAMLAEDIQRHLDGHGVLARRPSRLRSAVRFVRRHALASVIVATLAIAVLASSVLALATAQRERAQRERAEAVREFLVGVFAQANPDENKGQPFTAVQLLEKGERQLDEQRDAAIATRADLTAVIGDLYWQVGEFARAAPLLEKAVAASTDDSVPGDVEARARISLANMQAEKRAFDEALVNLDRAYALARNSGSAGIRLAADARRQRADVLVRRGDFAVAEPLLRELLAVDRDVSGARSAAVATDWRLLAICLEELSRYDESAAAFRESIAINRELHGDLHSSVAYALNDLGLMLMHRGDLAGAEAALRETLAIEAVLHGEQTRGYWAIESNLLRVIELEGRFAEALPARLAMLAKEHATLAETTPETLAFHTNFLGIDYRELGRFEEAEARFREALAMWQSIHGSAATPDSAPALMNLGVTLALQGRLAEAETTMQAALAIRTKHEPAGSLPLNQSRGEYGNLLRLLGRPTEAADEQRAAIDAYSAALRAAGNGRHPVLSTLLAQLAESQLDAGNAGAAETSANDALAMARETLPANNLRLGTSLFALARARLALEKDESAVPLLREALAVRSPPYPAGDPRVLEVEVALADALGTSDEAHALRRRLVPVLEALATPYARILLARLAGGPDRRRATVDRRLQSASGTPVAGAAAGAGGGT